MLLHLHYIYNNQLDYTQLSYSVVAKYSRMLPNQVDIIITNDPGFILTECVLCT